MSESDKDKVNNVQQPTATDRTMVMPFDPAGVELTQKIEVDHKKVISENNLKKKAALQVPSPENDTDSNNSDRDKKLSESLLGRTVFSRKRITDEFVRSSTILSSIDSIPPLEDDLELMDINRNYELKNKFSEGAQGIIRTAFDKSLKRDIVVKSLKKDEDLKLAKKDENLFVSEARIMAQLDHPSIIPLYGLHCSTDSKLHLAMKHIHGKTLQKYLQDIVALYTREGIEKFDEKRSIATRIEYFLKVCEAVDYAHCKGVIHRDLKPENIMIGNYGEVYVMDWGLACLTHPNEISDDEHITEIGMHAKNELVGTPCYIAPELIRGGECSPQSDIFSLGMILFEMITLERAVPGKSVNEVLKNIVNWNYRPFKHRFLKSKLPADLKAIIAKAICEPLSQRYKSAADIAKDLKLYLRREETAARPDNLFRKYVRAMVNHKLVTSIVIMAILLCFAASTIYSLYTQNQLMKEQEIREAMLTSFQHKVSNEANEMERIFFYLKSQLANGAYHAGHALSTQAVPARDWRIMSDYLNPVQAPADFEHAPAYGVKVSLDYSIMKPGPGTTPKDILNKRIERMARIYRHMLFTSSPIFENETTAKIRETITEAGAPLIFIFTGLKNGTMFSYPGKPYNKDYDPRKRPWYRKAAESKGAIVWSEPYKCAITSKMLICCARSIFDSANRFQGVIGMDVSLNYIQKKLFACNGDSQVKEYLMTPSGQIVLSSDFKDKNAKASRKATMVMKDFLFYEEFKKAVKKGKVYFTAKKFGRKYILGLNRLPSLGYYYIRQASEQQLLKNWMEKNHIPKKK